MNRCISLPLPSASLRRSPHPSAAKRANKVRSPFCGNFGVTAVSQLGAFGFCILKRAFANPQTRRTATFLFSFVFTPFFFLSLLLLSLYFLPLFPFFQPALVIRLSNMTLLLGCMVGEPRSVCIAGIRNSVEMPRPRREDGLAGIVIGQDLLLKPTFIFPI